MKRFKIKYREMVPVIAFLAILLFFVISSNDKRTGTFRMLQWNNLNSILAQVMQTIIIASGSLFVVSQGHIDMSVGVNLALAGTLGMWVSHATGLPILLIPATLIIALLVGVFNGFMVAKLKVPSFMLTLALLIGIRGLVNYIQVTIQTQRLPDSLLFLGNTGINITIFCAVLIAMAYVFEFTNVGRYSRAIGENETTAKFVGIPVTKTKIAAFALSGLMAGVAAIFSMVRIGSTSQQMGVFYEMKVIMAIFLGGVLVTGGASAKFYKILLGSFSIEIIINGLSIIGKGDSYISQSVQGTLLVLILVLYQIANMRAKRFKSAPDEPLPDATDKKACPIDRGNLK